MFSISFYYLYIFRFFTKISFCYNRRYAYNCVSKILSIFSKITISFLSNNSSLKRSCKTISSFSENSSCFFWKQCRMQGKGMKQMQELAENLLSFAGTKTVGISSPPNISFWHPFWTLSFSFKERQSSFIKTERLLSCFSSFAGTKTVGSYVKLVNNAFLEEIIWQKAIKEVKSVILKQAMEQACQECFQYLFTTFLACSFCFPFSSFIAKRSSSNPSIVSTTICVSKILSIFSKITMDTMANMPLGGMAASMLGTKQLIAKVFHNLFIEPPIRDTRFYGTSFQDKGIVSLNYQIILK